MTIKLNSLSRWRPYRSDVVVLQGHDTGERRVRLHFNVEAETAVYRSFGDTDDEQLLSVVGPGLETIEFSAAGEIRFFCVPRLEDAQVWFQTADDEPTFSRVLDPVVFTKIANRRHRNPEVEAMMQTMQINMERRFAQQAAEFDAALQRRRNEEENGRPSETVLSDAPGTTAVSGSEEVRPSDASAVQEPPKAGSKVDGK